MIYIIQALSAFFAALVISKTWNDFRKGQETLPVFIFWSSTWIIIVVFAFFPQLIEMITRSLNGEMVGMGRIFGMALVFIFYIVYRIYLKADRVEKNMARLVQDIALGKRQKRK